MTKSKRRRHGVSTAPVIQPFGIFREDSDWESLHLKPIFFPKQGKLGAWKYRLAVGVEWILYFRNKDKGIGSGSDQIAPLIGIAFMPGGGTVLIP